MEYLKSKKRNIWIRYASAVIVFALFLGVLNYLIWIFEPEKILGDLRIAFSFLSALVFLLSVLLARWMFRRRKKPKLHAKNQTTVPADKQLPSLPPRSALR